MDLESKKREASKSPQKDPSRRDYKTPRVSTSPTRSQNPTQSNVALHNQLGSHFSGGVRPEAAIATTTPMEVDELTSPTGSDATGTKSSSSTTPMDVDGLEGATGSDGSAARSPSKATTQRPDASTQSDVSSSITATTAKREIIMPPARTTESDNYLQGIRDIPLDSQGRSSSELSGIEDYSSQAKPAPSPIAQYDHEDDQVFESDSDSVEVDDEKDRDYEIPKKTRSAVKRPPPSSTKPISSKKPQSSRRPTRAEKKVLNRAKLQTTFHNPVEDGDGEGSTKSIPLTFTDTPQGTSRRRRGAATKPK